jgi:hypothetical protein
MEGKNGLLFPRLTSRTLSDKSVALQSGQPPGQSVHGVDDLGVGNGRKKNA